MPKELTDALIVSDGHTITISNIKFKNRRTGTIEDRQIKAQKRDAENLDNQPHMTLSPEKDGQPYHGSDRQRPSLLTAREAHRHGFHAGARWARRDEQRRQQKKREAKKE